jgi:hypothetical protein
MLQLLDEAINKVKTLPESEQERIALLIMQEISEEKLPPRKPGYWEEKVKMAADFDILPDDIINSFQGE